MAYTPDMPIISVVDMYDLGVLIKDIGDFDMATFDGRLRFQKTVQLLQPFGIDLGYYYNWYLRGPYCPDLAKDGFELKNVIDKIPKLAIEFADAQDQSRYDDFTEFIRDKKNDPKQLEIASSICFLRNEEGLDMDTVLKLTEGKRAEIEMSECEQVWGELKRYGVVDT